MCVPVKFYTNSASLRLHRIYEWRKYGIDFIMCFIVNPLCACYSDCVFTIVTFAHMPTCLLSIHPLKSSSATIAEIYIVHNLKLSQPGTFYRRNHKLKNLPLEVIPRNGDRLMTKILVYSVANFLVCFENFSRKFHHTF